MMSPPLEGLAFACTRAIEFDSAVFYCPARRYGVFTVATPTGEVFAVEDGIVTFFVNGERCEVYLLVLENGVLGTCGN